MLAEVAAVMPVAVKVRVTVPALVTYNPENVATPAAAVAVGAVVVAFKLPPLVSLAVITAFEDTGFPYGSSTDTSGCVAKAVPAVAVPDGCCMTTSLVGAAGLTLRLAEVVEVMPVAVKVRVTVAALVTYRPEKVATPAAAVAVCAVVVAFKLPPLVSAAVITAFEDTVLP